jgi:hypothetical protein
VTRYGPGEAGCQPPVGGATAERTIWAATRAEGAQPSEPANAEITEPATASGTATGRSLIESSSPPLQLLDTNVINVQCQEEIRPRRPA